MEPHEIHIDWEGPFPTGKLSDLQDESKDYGVYQIYGGHPVYGSGVLLYIGKAVDQTFGKRITQEEWEYNRDSENIEIYIGRLSGEVTPNKNKWREQISLAENLLIYSHKPALTPQSVYFPHSRCKNNNIYLIQLIGKGRELWISH